MAKVDIGRLSRRLKAIPDKARAQVRASLNKSADELIKHQRRLVSEDEGGLKESIRKEPGRHSLSIEVKAGSKDTFYGTFIEFGTSKLPARPFFFPPYRVLKKKIRSRTNRSIRKALTDK